jgi:hypothetical protein
VAVSEMSTSFRTVACALVLISTFCVMLAVSVHV